MATSVYGVFERFDDARKTAEDLAAAGFPEESISLISHPEAELHGTVDVEQPEGPAGPIIMGATIGGIAGFAAGLAIMTLPGLGPLLLLGPVLGAITVAGLGSFAGTLVGAVIAAGVPEEHAPAYAEAIGHGRHFVAVTVSEADVARAEVMFEQNGVAEMQEGDSGSESLVREKEEAGQSRAQMI